MLRRNSQHLLREPPIPGHYVDPWIQEIILVPGLLQTFSRYGLAVMRRGPYALTVITELPDNPGPSVTNNVAGIATILLRQHPLLIDVVPSELFVVEHYCAEHRRRTAPQYRDELDFALVQMRWSDALGYGNPQWHPIFQHAPTNYPNAPSFVHTRRSTSFKP